MVKSAHFIEAVMKSQQAGIIHHCINTKKKLFKIKAAAWFNKMCRFRHLTVKYIHIKVNGNKVKRTNTHAR